MIKTSEKLKKMVISQTVDCLIFMDHCVHSWHVSYYYCFVHSEPAENIHMCFCYYMLMCLCQLYYWIWQGWVRAMQRGTVKQYCYDNFLTPSSLLVTISLCFDCWIFWLFVCVQFGMVFICTCWSQMHIAVSPSICLWLPAWQMHSALLRQLVLLYKLSTLLTYLLHITILVMDFHV